MPEPYNKIFTAAAKKANVAPAIVAGIFYGGEHANSFPEPPKPYGSGKSWASSSAGAQGPFQFIPSTWKAYGVDGNGDGKKDVQDLTDGAFGAANYLAASGAKLPKPNYQKAIFAYNHAQWYVDNVMKAFKKFGGDGSASSSSDSDSDTENAGEGTAGCDGSSGSAFSIDGYSWPVDISKSELNSGYPWPCKGKCHHDGTYAFDLSTKGAVGGDDKTAVGKAMFAITDGEIVDSHTYMGISGCFIQQLKSSKDGYVYSYIHSKKAVKKGTKVKSGDKIAEIGERKCTGNGSYPHLHIDRGSPKGHYGGSPSARDAGITEILNKLQAGMSK